MNPNEIPPIDLKSLFVSLGGVPHRGKSPYPPNIKKNRKQLTVHRKPYTFGTPYTVSRILDTDGFCIPFAVVCLLYTGLATEFGSDIRYRISDI